MNPQLLYKNILEERKHVEECRRTIANGRQTFDLVYYVTCIMIRHYTADEIKSDYDYLSKQLDWLDKVTSRSLTISGQFYHEQVLKLKDELGNKQRN